MAMPTESGGWGTSAEEDWELLAKEWGAVRDRVTRLRALADELALHCEHWERVIAEHSETTSPCPVTLLQ